MATKKQTTTKGNISVDLSCGERFHLVMLMPNEGRRDFLRTRRAVIEKLQLTEKEERDIEFEEIEQTTTCTRCGEVLTLGDSTGFKWNPKLDKEKPVSFTGFEHKLIVERLDKVEKEGKLHTSLELTWDKFCSDGKETE